jgi:trimeric autotransporter adhesin
VSRLLHVNLEKIMKLQIPRSATLLALAAALSGSLLLGACGGGGGGESTPPVVTPPVVTPPVVTPPISLAGVVADGLIKGARVCYDLNDNGLCDTGEPVSSDTDSKGAYTLAVPAEQAGKHAVIAIVPVGAVDADTGTVTTPYTLKAPPQVDTSKSLFVSPITTIVLDVMQASGTTDTVAAIQQVKLELGMTISPLDNFIALRDTGSAVERADAARVGTIAQIVTAVRQEVQKTAEAAQVPPTNTQALLSVVVINNLSKLAESVAELGTKTASASAATLVASNGITSATVAAQAQVAVIVASAKAETTTASVTPVPFVTLRDFRYTNAANWNYRVFTGDDVADSQGFKFANEVRKTLKNNVDVPFNRNAAYWLATENRWYSCPSSGYKVIRTGPPNSSGETTSDYCSNAFTDKFKRTNIDIAGRTMASVVNEIRGSGLPSYDTWGPTVSQLTNASATFPAGSILRYQVSTNLTTPDSHNLFDKVRVFKDTTKSSFGEWPFASSLDEMLQYYQGGFSGSVGGSSTDGLGEIADASVTDPNLQKLKNFRVSFQSTGTTTGNVRFYLCRRNLAPPAGNGFTNCSGATTPILTSTYTITTQGDARVLRFAAFPSELEAFRKFRRIYVERSGAVMYGGKDIIQTTTTIRMNKAAWDALRAQVPGVTAHLDPTPPVASESGVWLRDMREGTNASGSDTFNIRAFKWTSNPAGTGGTSDEVRLNLVNGTPTAFARNTQYLIGGVWKDADGVDQQCPSNGIGISTFTNSPRGGTFCNYSTDTATSFDADISGKAISTTVADMRRFGSFDFGRDFSSYGPSIPSNSTDTVDIAYNAAVFPPGSFIRYQAGMTTSSAPQLFTGNQVLNGTVSFANLSAMRASFAGNYGSGSATGGRTLGVYSYQSNSTPAAGTTGQKRLRVAFDPASGSTAMRWYLCDQSSTTTFTIGCNAVLDSTWSVTTEGGKNVLRFASTPPGIDAQRNSRTLLIEHNSSVYVGSEDVLNNKTYSQRLNAVATNAIFRILTGNSNFDIATKSTCTAGPCPAP